MATIAQEFRQEGFQIGLKEGIGIGREEGREEGINVGQRQIIQQMLSLSVAPAEITKLTGVPLARVLQVQSDVTNNQL